MAQLGVMGRWYSFTSNMEEYEAEAVAKEMVKAIINLNIEHVNHMMVYKLLA